MAKFESVFIGFALAGLLIISLFSFGVTLQEDNNAPDRLTEVVILNETFTSLKTNLDDTRDLSQNQLDIFETEEPQTGFGSLLLFSIVSSGQTFTSIIIGTFNLIIKLPMIWFGVDPVVSNILSTIMIIIFILGLWILYKLGG